MPVSDEYGPKIEMALRAINQMHIDVRNLILLLDKEMGRSPIVVRITDQARFSVNADVFMPEGMHRIYAVPDSPGRVEGITVVFIDLWGQPVSEPMLLVGQAQFNSQASADLKRTITEGGNLWCLWDAYLRWQDQRPVGKLLQVQPPPNKDDVDEKASWVNVIAKPLYSIKAIADVMSLLQQVRAVAPRG